MKIFLLLLLMLSSQVFAQFGNRTIIDNNTGIADITSQDLNNDGFLDIIIAQKYSYDNISYYINLGNGTFGNQQTIDFNINNPEAIAAADLNNDGWIDIVSATSSLYLFTNNSENNFVVSTLDTNTEMFSQIFKIKIADMDNDMDMDIVTISDTELNIYYNNGTGNFTKSAIEPNIITEYYDLTLADIDNDSYIDIIVGGIQPIIYKNTNGIINYDELRTNSIVNLGLVILVELNDFDNDGDNDLLISGNNQTDLRWYENNGNGFFSLSQIFQVNISHCESATSKDFDQDGDVDIFTIFPQTGKVVWYENFGDGNFGVESIIYIGETSYTKYVHSADFNNDGKPDIVWSQKLSIHLNEFLLNTESSILINNFKTYPNPILSGILRVESKENAKLSIYNNLGQLVFKNYKINKGNNSIKLNLQPQIYFMILENKKSVITKKIIIK